MYANIQYLHFKYTRNKWELGCKYVSIKYIYIYVCKNIFKKLHEIGNIRQNYYSKVFTKYPKTLVKVVLLVKERGEVSTINF